MSRDRMRRVDEAIREVIGDALVELKDPRVGFVTVTDVRTSADMSRAQVWVSVLDGSLGERALAGLASAHGHLQRVLARELRLKRTPVLSFHYDDTAERAQRISALIDRGQAGGG